MRDADQPLYTRRTAIVSLAMAIAFASLLYWQGRPLWCKYGVGLWTGAWDHCTSQHLLDPYTLSHVLHGIIFYWLLWPLGSKLSLPRRNMTALALEIGWELLENSAWVIERYRQQTAALDYVGDSVLNSMGDVLASLLGFCVASRFSWKVSVGVFIVFELGMLLLARDNLTLNVLMLFFPIEAIKHWQLNIS